MTDWNWYISIAATKQMMAIAGLRGPAEALATDTDVELLREARGAVLSVIDYRAWAEGRPGTLISVP